MSWRLARAALVAVLTWSAPAYAVGPERDAASPEGPQQMLLGVIIGGREVAVAEVFYDGSEFLIPIEEFEAFCECTIVPGGDGFVVSTALGDAVLGALDIREIDGVRYLGESALRDRLASEVSYSSSRYALVLDLPWHGRRGTSAAPSLFGARPAQVRAPRASLSTLQFRARHSRSEGVGASEADAVVSGRAGGGLWRMRYADDLAGRRQLDEYGWLRTLGNKLMMVGYQRLNVHPLLGGLEMTGVQGAWTNQPLDYFAVDPTGRDLLPRQLRTGIKIRGAGVAAGTAVLRVNDQTVAMQIIPLDGVYEFAEVALAASRANRVEVLIYERDNPNVPVDVHDHSRFAARELLPAGAAIVQGGVGRAGNLLNASEVEGPAGRAFAQARYGASERVTLEAAAQTRGATPEIALGASTRVSDNIVASGFAAHREGRFGYLATVDAQTQRWALNASSQIMSQPSALGSQQVRDHLVDVRHRTADARFEIGLVGRSHFSFGRKISFLRPTLSARPFDNVWLRLRPNFDGDYRFDATWRASNRMRLGASRAAGTTSLAASLTIDRRWRGTASLQALDGAGERYSLLATWQGFGRWQPALSAGPSFTNGRVGAALAVQAVVAPGVLLAARYYSTPLTSRSFDGAPDSTSVFSVSLISNLAFAGSRVMPGSFVGSYGTRGGIAGKVRVAGGYKVDPEELGGLTVLVDGQPRTRTRKGGRYLISNLPPGVYQVEIDPGHLPVELTQRERRLNVEVATGAMTRADFNLDVYFGIAGRVVVNGQRLAGVLVELLDSAGTVTGSARTDRFGLYRIDEIPVGTYRLRLAPANAPGRDIVWPSRTVEVRDDFLFGQDLRLDVPERSPDHEAFEPFGLQPSSASDDDGAADGGASAPNGGVTGGRAAPVRVPTGVA